MQNKGKVTAIALAVGIVVVCGGLFIAKQNMQEREDQIVMNLKKIEKLLPPQVKQENILNKGLFSSSGIYKLNYLEKGKTDSLVVDYTLEHGLSSWFGGDIKFVSKVNFTGALFKDVKITDPQWMKINGNIKKNGSFDMVGNGSKTLFAAVDRNNLKTNVTVEPSNLLINYDKPSGDVKFELVYPTINISGKENGSIKNIKFLTDFNAKEPDLGDFSLKVEHIKDKSFEIKNVDISGKSELVKDKLEMLASFKVANLSIAPLAQKDVQLELTYSFKGIDKVALEIYREMYATAAKENEITEEIKEKFVEGMKQVLKTGLIVSLDKFYVKSSKGLIDFSGAVELKPSATVQDISFEKNTKLKFDLLISGEYAQMATSMVPPEQSEMIILDDKNNIKMSLIFERGIFKLNDKEFAPEYTEQINMALQGLDAQFKK